MSENGILSVLAEKSGLGHNVVNRANEMHRLVQAQGCLGPGAFVGASSTAMVVICLHLVSCFEIF